MKRMKKILLTLLLAPLMALALFLLYHWIKEKVTDRRDAKEHTEWLKTAPSTASDNVYLLEDTILIDYLNEKRTLSIYLPTGYDTASMHYPVIYFLDGQSLFDQRIQRREWQVDEVLDSMFEIGPQAIIVGVYNSDNRMREYKPFPSEKIYSHKRISGDKHAEWIAHDLKPWIDQKYRTKPEPESTVIAGASLGGLMSYYMAMKYPDIFNRAIVFSPSFWVHQKVYDLHKFNPHFRNQKIYFNAGELETPTVNSIHKMAELLLMDGASEDNIRYEVELGEGHYHSTWRKGFRKAYPWILE